MLRHGYWVVPWLVGETIIGHFGEYGGNNDFNSGFAGEWTDLVVVIIFSLVMYYWAVATAQPISKVLAAVKDDEDQIEAGEVLNVPMTS